MIDISKGRYWDKPWSLVDGCTPCSPGCDHCWSAGMAHRFDHPLGNIPQIGRGPLTTLAGKFNGQIKTHPERLSIPLKRRKPTVYAVWNDLFHEAVPGAFIFRAIGTMHSAPRHTFLVLTKRPQSMVDITKRYQNEWLKGFESAWPREYQHVSMGLTVCNQQEADEKIPVFLDLPGKKFLSIEPMLGAIDLRPAHLPSGITNPYWLCHCIDAVILGGETGPGARPMHPDWVRSVRDQCAAAGVDFFFKGWGDDFFKIRKVSKKNYGSVRTLDGRTHDDLPWVTP